ncbi:MAG: LLM class flavin-dependent oxidoreductase [Rhodobacteraceae bacterium]|nr:LLM class flavin-dependent oxidoreductase [Paracoccaceae bacterium]
MLRPRLCIGMSLAPTWLSGEGWRAEDSGIEGLYSSDFALTIARRAEAAHLDFAFRPDASFLPVEVLEQSFGFSSLDPTLMMAALTRETSRIGLVTTISTTFGHPYTAARQMMSLHWLSQGRSGWNVVTALQGNENFGLRDMPASDDRYDRAEEFTRVVQRLWQSFPDEALLVDRASGRYADTDLILPIDHHGNDFSVKGPLNIPRFPGPRPALMQAGGSPRGIDFAAQMADMVFGLSADRTSALTQRKALTDRARAHGRDPAEVRFLPGLSLYLGATRAEARALFMDTHARVTRPQRIERVQAATGLDLADWAPDRPITPADLPRDTPRTGQYARLLQLIDSEAPTLAQLLDCPETLASFHWQVIGTVDDAVAEITDWFRAGAIDGFIAVPGGSWQSFELTLSELVPRLAEAGLFRQAYSADTLMGHLQEDSPGPARAAGRM